MTTLQIRPAPPPHFLRVVVSALVLALPAVAPAQAPEPGARVRVTHTKGRQVGTLRSIGSDTIRFTTEAGVDFDLAASEVAALEQSAGRHRQFLKHFVIATTALAATGGALGLATYEPCESTGFLSCLMTPDSRSEAMVWGGILGGIVGIPVGLIAGVAMRTERWVPVAAVGEALSRVSIRMTPMHGVGISGSYVIGSGLRR